MVKDEHISQKIASSSTSKITEELEVINVAAQMVFHHFTYWNLPGYGHAYCLVSTAIIHSLCILNIAPWNDKVFFFLPTTHIAL